MKTAAVDKLTAVGVTAHGEVRTTLFGYAAHKVIHLADRPVLIVR